MRIGNWLTAEQGRRLLAVFERGDLRGKRDYAMVAVLLGCGLRRAEAAALAVEDLQQREEHWVIADLVGKGGHVRTVPVPAWVKTAVDNWLIVANVTTGPIFRAINKAERIGKTAFSPKVIWGVVKAGCLKCGLQNVAPHDMRRTCARLCHEAGGELAVSYTHLDVYKRQERVQSLGLLATAQHVTTNVSAPACFRASSNSVPLNDAISANFV